MKWGLSEQAFAILNWQSQTFGMILPSWWWNPLTILICKLVICQNVAFLLECSRWRPDNEPTTEAGPIRNWKRKNTVPHQRYYYIFIYLKTIYPGNVCWAWTCFLTNTLISIQTVSDTPGSCKCTQWTSHTGHAVAWGYVLKGTLYLSELGI